MLLVLHIIVALAGLAASTLAVFTPSNRKINLSLGLVIATIVSGSILVVSTHSPILESCVTGLVYTGVCTSLIVSAKYRLAKAAQID